MRKVKTWWEARWTGYGFPDSSRGESSTQVRIFDRTGSAEAECRVFAMQQALENGKTNRGDRYTEVRVVECEQHEAVHDDYTRDKVLKAETKPREVPTKGTLLDEGLN